VKVTDLSGVRDMGTLIGFVDELLPPPSPSFSGASPRASTWPSHARFDATDDPDVMLDESGFFIVYVK
jgi:hypothetical protein